VRHKTLTVEIVDTFEVALLTLPTLRTQISLLCQWRRQIVPNGGEKVYQSG